MNYEDQYNDSEQLSADEEAEISLNGAPVKPLFPFMILLVALLKDFIDFISFGFLGILTSIVAGLVIWLWMLGKIGMIQKRLTKWFLRRFIIAMFIESIPLVSMLPITTILVLLAHNKEKVIVQKFYLALEKLHPLVGGA